MSYDAEVLADAPLSYWKLDETSGPVLDSVGGLSGTLSGGVTQGVSGIANSGKAVLLANDGRIDFGVAPFAFDGTTPFSIELWIEPDEDDGRLISHFEWAPSAKGWFWDLSSSGGPGSGHLNFQVAPAFSSFADLNSVPPYGSEPLHSVVTWNGNADKHVYRNVDFLPLTGSPVLPWSAPDGPLWIGAWVEDGDPGFVGKMARVAIYDHALTPERIAAHYAAGIAVDAPATRPDRWPAKTILAPRTKATLEDTVCGRTGGLESTICRWSP